MNKKVIIKCVWEDARHVYIVLMEFLVQRPSFSSPYGSISARSWLHLPSRRWRRWQAGQDAEQHTGRACCEPAGCAADERCGSRRSGRSQWSCPRPGAFHPEKIHIVQHIPPPVRKKKNTRVSTCRHRVWFITYISQIVCVFKTNKKKVSELNINIYYCFFLLCRCCFMLLLWKENSNL